MQNASSEYLRSLSRTNVAATMVSTVTDVSRWLQLYCRGEITGAVCIERLGQQEWGSSEEDGRCRGDGRSTCRWCFYGCDGWYGWKHLWDMLQLLPYMRNYPLPA